MAMRPQTDGSRPNLYESFQPVSEWKEEPENKILVVHLPGFTRDQIAITCVRSPRLVRVTGRRRLPDDKWSRYNQAFQIPQNCIMDKIQAKWDDGALTITMPKETKTAQEAPKDYQQAASPKAAAEPKSSTDYQQVAPGKAAATSTDGKQNEVKKDAVSRKATSGIHNGKKEEGRSIDSLIAQKWEKEAHLQKGDRKYESAFPESASASTPMKQTDKGSPVPKEKGTRIENIVAESKKTEDATEETTQVKESAFPEASVKEKEKEDKSVGDEKTKEKKDDFSAKTMEKKSIARASVKAVKGLSLEQNGDKQLFINIGVAALVLVALGAYISNSFGSKSKD